MPDFRSDTVTQPTPAMREAMFKAPLGDDVFADDPSVNALQEHAAELLGFEAALFAPSGTQTNLMVVASGNYSFGDFAKLGGILTLILGVSVAFLTWLCGELDEGWKA